MTDRGEPRPRVLIVEDDAATAIALRALFHHGADWGAIIAGNLAEARSYLDECTDAVLLDLLLPDGNGEDLIDEIRDRCPGCRIVVVTGLPDGGPRIDAVKALRPDAIVHKPYYIDDLLAAVRGPAPDPAG